ncbi:MAG: glycoside hydrolase/phage tail family protein [Aquisalinus sp.]|nr:glycoside hydrolase/phage tail family protein [Aquisalinus sp.]
MTQLILTSAQAVGNAAAGAANALAQIAASGLANAASAYALGAAQNLIFGPVRRQVEGTRLEQIRLQGAAEGAPVPTVYGRARLAGQVIWATRFREEATTTTSRSGKGTGRRLETETTTYQYTISLAIGLCTGPINRIARIWADGKPFSLSGLTWRLYTGNESQMPDALIEAVEGSDNAPAYRGLAYIVFEDLPLARFGNRIPQFNFEIERSLTGDAGSLEQAASAVNIIPASGESAYATTPVLVTDGEGRTTPDNQHNTIGVPDFTASMAALTGTLPNVQHAALIVSWFGTDLRPAFCDVRPGVELRDKETLPFDWQVSSTTRDEAYVVSQIDGNPAYGGTPSDRAVVEAIQHLKSQGIEVMFHPFLLMDIPAGNTLTDPDGAGSQPAFPWRGRLRPGLEDQTAAARQGIDALFGATAPADFQTEEDTVIYTGAEEWSLRRMVLHYAHLCEVAGGVSSFLIGSEWRGVTTARDEDGLFPAVEALRQLAADVRSILRPETEISYAADWSEYFGYQPTDGSGDVLFHLDPLWADSNIDFIGIDNYMPLADWRDTEGHLDEPHAQGRYDPAYLSGNIAAGEGYDWYYASAADRESQIRTPIVDTAHGEDWVFRYKDIQGWWENPHHDRPGGVRAATPTSWQPQSKPVVFTELGCAAIDKGANQPNVFLDPKSAESTVPYFSTGQRDDLMQRRFLEAHLAFWQKAQNNPVSPQYGGAMVRADQIYLYAWDARPYPDFPLRSDIWTDAGNWQTGHWLNGRAGRIPLDLLVRDIAQHSGLLSVDVAQVNELVTGYVIDRPMSARAALEPLLGLYQLDVVERGQSLVFLPRGATPVAELRRNDLVADIPDFSITRTDMSDLPEALSLIYSDPQAEYETAVAEARLVSAPTQQQVTLSVPVVLEPGEAQGRAAALIADALQMNTQASFALPPSRMLLEPGDVVSLQSESGQQDFRLAELLDGTAREAQAVSTSSDIFDWQYTAQDVSPLASLQVFGPPVVEVLDLPVLEGGEAVLHVAGFADPWPGRVSVYEQLPGSESQLLATLNVPARLARLEAALSPGPVATRDRGGVLQLRLLQGSLSSVETASLFAGNNRLAVESLNGAFEILGFARASLQADGSWQLGELLRGLNGTEEEAALGAVPGARVVILDDALTSLPLDLDTLGLDVTHLAAPAGDDPSGFTAVSQTRSFAGLGLRPLAPVHLKVRRVAGGVQLGWTRRTRQGGDNWALPDVPLAETQERYELKLYDGDAVVRTQTLSSTAYLYTDSDIQADFGMAALPPEFSFTVAQISDTFGPGREGRWPAG